MYIWTDFDEQGRVCAVNKNSVGYTPGAVKWAIGEYDDSYFMDGSGKVLKRPVLTPKVESVDGGFVVSGLPVPSTVTVDGTAYEVDDGAFEFETPIHATFKVTIDSWPYRTWRGEVTT